MKKLFGALCAFLSLAGAARAEEQRVQIPLLIDYDIEGSTFAHSQGVPIATFGATSRAEGVLNNIDSSVRISTTAASTTVTATVASSAPFTALQVGDFIRWRIPTTRVPDVMDALEGGQTPWMKVVTKTNANQITVNLTQTSATPAEGVPFQWRRAIQATTEGAGWIPVSTFDEATFVVRSRVHVAASGGLDVSVECRPDQPGNDTYSWVPVSPRYGSDGTTIFPGGDCGAAILTANATYAYCTVLSAGGVSLTVDARPWHECRLRLGFADDVEGATVDRVYATFVGTSK